MTDLDRIIEQNRQAREAERKAEDEERRLVDRIADPEAAAQQDREDAELRQRLERLGVAFEPGESDDDGD